MHTSDDTLCDHFNSVTCLKRFKEEPDYEKWENFPAFMWEQGYEMDCYNSFRAFADQYISHLKVPVSKKQERKNNLFILEKANRQIVGNYLFSHWRYLTYWAWGSDEFEGDYLQRILEILEQKYSDEVTD